jgi:hypothetical protein
MKTLDCQHCGAKLAIDTEPLPAEVRCKRCGRRTATANAKPARGPAPPAEASAPTVPYAAPTPEVAPHGAFGTRGPERRVQPEDIPGVLRPRPDFYREESIIPGNRGATGVVAGGVVGVLLSLGLAIGWMVDWGRAPQQTGTYVGERERVVVDAAGSSTAGSGGAPLTPEPPAAPPRVPAEAPPTTPRPDPPSVKPPDAPQAATLADAIDVSTELCNRDVFLASEVALREFERKFSADLPEIELGPILKAANDEKINVFHLLGDIKHMNAAYWIKSNRPTLCLQLKSSLKRPTKATIRVGLKDTFARSLFNGGVSSASDSAIEWRDDGTAQLPFYLSLDQAKIYELKSPVTVNLEFIVEYEDKSRETPIPHEIRVHPVNYIELTYPFAYSFATMVDEDHPIVKDLVNKISGSSFCKRTGITMGGGGVDLRALFAVWRELKARGIRYSSITKTSTLNVQEVRSLQECLRGADQGHANCADGSVLLASIYQKIGASPNLVVIPRHMFLMFSFEGVRGGWLGLETTMLASDGTPDKAWHEFVHGLPGIPEFEKRLTASERAQWLGFLAALQAGTDTVMMCRDAIFEGLPKERANSFYPDGTASAKEYLIALDAERGKDDDKARRIWVELQTQFLSYCDISEARSDGVKPIGHDPKSLPNDLAGPLKAP